MHKLSLIFLLLVVIMAGCISQQKKVEPVLNTAPKDPYLCRGYAPSSESKYILPYKTGKDFRLVQGNCSRYSHFGLNRYAYDFGLPIKTEIVAARGGIVLSVDMVHPDNYYSVKKRYKKTGKTKGNCILIQHSDGTVAVYYHLMQNSATVSNGDRVVQGQKIAQSGNSGFTTGAHLHFEVRESDIDRQTIPVTFKNASPDEIYDLKSGNRYRAMKIVQPVKKTSFLDFLY